MILSVQAGYLSLASRVSEEMVLGSGFTRSQDPLRNVRFFILFQHLDLLQGISYHFILPLQ